MSVISGPAFVQALVDAGVLPEGEKIVRVVIDAQPNHVLVMHVQYLADSRILSVVPGLGGVEIRRDEKAVG